jgi:hypothetical protein
MISKEEDAMRSLVSVISSVTLVMVLAVATLPVQAADMEIPAGTSVPLTFLSPVDSSTIQEGAAVRFEVASDVLVGRTIVFRRGAPARGTVTDVSQPGIFGASARIHIGFIQANAVDGRPVRLSPLDITPQAISQVENTGAAAGSSVAGAILLGPIGLAAGALIHGNQVSLPAGAVGISKVATSFRMTAP